MRDFARGAKSPVKNSILARMSSGNAKPINTYTTTSRTLAATTSKLRGTMGSSKAAMSLAAF
jgi:hypothetical protein